MLNNPFLILAVLLASALIFVAWTSARSRKSVLMRLDSASQVCDLGNDPILVADIVHGNFLHANPAACRLLGLSRDEVLKRSLPELHPAHLQARSAEIIADVWEKKGLVYADLPFVLPSGDLVDVEVSANVMTYMGQPAILLYVRDIRERVKMEARIRDQNSELQRLNNKINDLFGRYVSGQVRDAILSGQAAMGGEAREVTILFSDLRGFTNLSSQTPPDQLVKMLNRYFTRMVGAVTAHHGVVDKFIGDAVMAVFGAPEEDKSHALHATLAARAMIQELEAFNKEQESLGQPKFKIGVGIASGTVIAGNLGAEQRMEYTVVGDAVNLASRIEGMTKTLGVPVLLNEDAARVAGSQFKLWKFPNVEVRGLAKRVQLFTFLEPGGAGAVNPG